MDPSILDPTVVLQLIALVQRVPYIGPVLVYVPLACTLASIIDAAVPQPAAGSVWVWPRRVVHVIALSLGWARNAIPAGAVPASVAAKAAETKSAADDAVAKAGELQQTVAQEVAAVPVHVTGDAAPIAVETASDHLPPRFDDAATRLLKG